MGGTKSCKGCLGKQRKEGASLRRRPLFYKAAEGPPQGSWRSLTEVWAEAFNGGLAAMDMTNWLAQGNKA